MRRLRRRFWGEKVERMSQKSLQSMSPRERYTKLLILASSEISLLTAVLLLFFIYSYGENLYLASFSLGMLLVGSLLIRHSIQIAQIVLVVSVLIVEVIFLLNADLPSLLPSWFTPDAVPVLIVLLDLVIIFQVIKSGGLPGERS